jgi:hypothetical protein
MPEWGMPNGWKGVQEAHKKKGDEGLGFELVVGPSPCCVVPSRTEPRPALASPTELRMHSQHT